MVTAKWRKGTYDKDKTGTELTEKVIFVEEKSLSKSDSNYAQGITSHTWKLALISPSEIAKGIVAGDMIIYNKHKYTVQNTESKKNRLGYNKFDTIIYLI